MSKSPPVTFSQIPIKEDEDELKCCYSCGDDIKEINHCRICNTDVCQECYDGKEINYSEYLQECTSTCEECNTIGCIECIQICSICFDEGDMKFVCNHCIKYKKIDCDHELYLCKIHESRDCPECFANKNFIGKNE